MIRARTSSMAGPSTRVKALRQLWGLFSQPVEVFMRERATLAPSGVALLSGITPSIECKHRELPLLKGSHRGSSGCQTTLRVSFQARAPAWTSFCLFGLCNPVYSPVNRHPSPLLNFFQTEGNHSIANDLEGMLELLELDMVWRTDAGGNGHLMNESRSLLTGTKKNSLREMFGKAPIQYSL